MKIEFNSVEEVLEFADRFRPSTVVGQLTPKGFDPTEVARCLGRVAEDGRRAKIPAIRIYRALTGESLIDSKAAIERFRPFQLTTDLGVLY